MSKSIDIAQALSNLREAILSAPERPYRIDWRVSLEHDYLMAVTSFSDEHEASVKKGLGSCLTFPSAFVRNVIQTFDRSYAERQHFEHQGSC